MPLRDDLLNPIPGDNPGGENLRYAAILDKIKEARREEEDVPQGEWQHERKTADYPLVIKLAGEALATKSKDLQLAAWMTEALLKQEGFVGLRAGLEVIRGLLDKFWDHLYPEIEDGDAELRAAPLEWLGGRMDSALRGLALTQSGLNWFQFKESRVVGYEADADTPGKLEARAAALADGKTSGEDWDKGFQATPKRFYADLETTLDVLLETLAGLSEISEAKFADAAPSFAPMRATLEDIRHTARGLVQKKRETEPEEAQPSEEAPAEAVTAEAAPAKARQPREGAIEPMDREDAFRRVMAAAAYLRREDSSNPVPYLLMRALRLGELRAAGADVECGLLEPPPTAMRQSLRKAAAEGEWQQVLEIAENAAGMPCGRGWLDLQRYADTAAYQLGYSPLQAAIRAEIKALLADYPALRRTVLLDDTPTANPETQAWIDEITAQSEPQLAAPASVEAPINKDGEALLDANDLALAAAQQGRPQEAIEILTREIAAEQSGRRRFQRRLQLAQLCMSLGHERIAEPILEQLAAEVDSRNLEGWEEPGVVAQPLVLLFRCLAKAGGAAERRQEIYNHICRLDPLQAVACGR